MGARALGPYVGPVRWEIAGAGLEAPRMPRLKAAIARLLLRALPPGDKRQTLEQVYVLLVLEKRPVEGWDQLPGLAFAQRLGRNILVEQQLDPVEQLRGGGFLLDARHLAHVVEHLQCLADEASLEIGEVHLNDRAHRLRVRKLDVVEEASTQEGVGQLLFVIGGDDDDRAMLGLDG